MISSVFIIISTIAEVCTILAFFGMSPEALGIDTYSLLKYAVMFLCVLFGAILGWNLRIKYEEKFGTIYETISDLQEAPYEVKVNLARAYINGYFIEEESEPYAFGFIPMGYTKTNEDWYDEFCHKVSIREGFRYELKPKIRKIIKKNQDIIEDAKNDV